MAFIVALIIDGLAPSFGGMKNQVQALKTVAYAWTPVWIVGILQLFPFLGVLTILVLLAALIYSIYLLNLGSQHTMQVPSTRSAGFTAVVIIISIVIGFVLSMIVGLVSGVSGAMSGAMHSPTTIGAHSAATTAARRRSARSSPAHSRPAPRWKRPRAPTIRTRKPPPRSRRWPR